MAHKAVNPLLSPFYKLAQELICYILYSWIPSPHSWRMNMDILRPRGFLSCASQDRKCSAWLLIGRTHTRKKGERCSDRRRVMLTVSSSAFFKMILSRSSTSVPFKTFGFLPSVGHMSLSQWHPWFLIVLRCKTTNLLQALRRVLNEACLMLEVDRDSHYIFIRN